MFKDMRGGQFKPGPGADGPVPAVGFARFWFILRTHPGKLIIGNVLFVLFSVPLVTAPAALCGLNAIIARLMEDGHCYPSKDFFEGFKSAFWSKTLFGLPFFTVITGVIVMHETGLRGIWLYVAIVIACFFFFSGCCFYTSTAGGRDPIPRLFMMSFSQCCSCRRMIRLCPALISAGFFAVFRISLMPLFLLIGMSFVVILAHAAIQKQ